MKRIALVLLGVVMLVSWVWADEAEDLLRSLIKRIERLEGERKAEKVDGLEALLERAEAGDVEAKAALQRLRGRIDKVLGGGSVGVLVRNDRGTIVARRNALSRKIDRIETQLARFKALDGSFVEEIQTVERERKQLERKLAEIARREAALKAGLDTRADLRNSLESELDELRRQRHLVDRQIEKLDEETR